VNVTRGVFHKWGIKSDIRWTKDGILPYMEE
jgi:hypothetical protein